MRRETFDLFDKDGGGAIDCDELADVFKSMGREPDMEEIRRLVAKVDIDNSGLIEYDEFSQLLDLLKHREEETEKNLQL